MVRGQVIFLILTTIVIPSFLWRFQMNSAIQKKRGTDHGLTDPWTDRPSYRDAWMHLKMRNTGPLAMGEVGLEKKWLIWQFWERITGIFLKLSALLSYDMVQGCNSFEFHRGKIKVYYNLFLYGFVGLLEKKYQLFVIIIQNNFF